MAVVPPGVHLPGRRERVGILRRCRHSSRGRTRGKRHLDREGAAVRPTAQRAVAELTISPGAPRQHRPPALRRRRRRAQPDRASDHHGRNQQRGRSLETGRQTRAPAPSAVSIHEFASCAAGWIGMTHCRQQDNRQSQALGRRAVHAGDVREARCDAADQVHLCAAFQAATGAGPIVKACARCSSAPRPAEGAAIGKRGKNCERALDSALDVVNIGADFRPDDRATGEANGDGGHV